MNRTIIGEGAYGCVHKPSIHCKTPPSRSFNYTNYVSKIMTTKNAKKELGVPQKDIKKALEEVRKAKANITVTNLTRTKRRKP